MPTETYTISVVRTRVDGDISQTTTIMERTLDAPPNMNGLWAAINLPPDKPPRKKRESKPKAGATQ